MTEAMSTSVPRGPSSSPRVLFVSHEASRTGAPILLLHFVRWLRDHTDLDFEILLLAGGPLTADFAAVAPTHVVEALGTTQASYIEAGIAKAGFPRLSDRLKVARAQRSVDHLGGFDVLYMNSTTSALALRILPEVPPVVCSHIHELGSAFSYWFPEQDRRAMLEATDWFVACAEAVATNLVESYGVAPEQVSCHYEFIDPPTADPARAQRLRRSLGLPDDAFLVGASGVVIWRKGPDLFVQAAAALRRSDPDLDVHFVWVGGPGDERIPVEQDIAGLGLEGRVHFVGELSDPGDLFSTLDAFCLTSREDPYPLVMLEAAALGVPIVSFANGGAVEFAGDTGDLATRRAAIVPYLDAEAMGATVAHLLRDPVAAREMAGRGQRRVLDEHTIEVGAAALHAELLARAGDPASTRPIDLTRRAPRPTSPTNDPPPPALLVNQ